MWSTYRSAGSARSWDRRRQSRRCGMSVTGWLQARKIEVAWVAFALANLIAMLLTPDWETIPFHFIWVSLTILYGFRVWGLKATSIILGAVAATTGAVILGDAFEGSQL